MRLGASAEMAACLDVVNAALFPAPSPSYGIHDFDQELIWIPRSLDPRKSAASVPCLLFTSPSARFFVIYLHSNAEDLGRCHKFCSLMRNFFHVHVLAVEYPGYGVCPGRADEESVTENARLALRFLTKVLEWPLDSILVFGRSVGCGPAIALAAETKVYGLVLVCPFLSVKELCRSFMGSLADFVGERFPNMQRIKFVQSPLLLIHGQADSMVPVAHGKALFDACRARKHFVSPERMEHNAYLYSDVQYLVLPMLHFFGLPDYVFSELQIPDWVFDKRLSHLCSGSYSPRKGSPRKAPAMGPATPPRATPRATPRGGPVPGKCPLKEPQAGLCSPLGSEGSTAVSEPGRDGETREEVPEPPEDPRPVPVPLSCPDGPQLTSCML